MRHTRLAPRRWHPRHSLHLALSVLVVLSALYGTAAAPTSAAMLTHPAQQRLASSASSTIPGYAASNRLVIAGGGATAGGSTLTPVSFNGTDYVVMLHLSGGQAATVYAASAYSSTTDNGVSFADVNLFWRDSSGTQHQLDTDFDTTTFGAWSPSNITLWFKLQTPLAPAPATDTSYTLAWGNASPACTGPANCFRTLANIYPFASDFSSWDTTTWGTQPGYASLSGGVLSLNAAAGSGTRTLTAQDPFRYTTGYVMETSAILPNLAANQHVYAGEKATAGGVTYTAYAMAAPEDSATKWEERTSGAAGTHTTLMGAYDGSYDVYSVARDSAGYAYTWRNAYAATKAATDTTTAVSQLTLGVDNTTGSAFTAHYKWVKVRPWFPSEPTVAFDSLTDYAFKTPLVVTGGGSVVGGSTSVPVATNSSDYVVKIHLTGAQANAIFTRSVYNTGNLYNGVPYADVAIFYRDPTTGVQRQIDADPDTSTYGPWSATNVTLWFKLQRPLNASPATDTSYTLAWGNTAPYCSDTSHCYHDLSNIYAFWDDFTSTTVDTTKWSANPGAGSSLTIANSVITMTATSTSGSGSIYQLTGIPQFSVGYVSSWRVKLPGAVGGQYLRGGWVGTPGSNRFESFNNNSNWTIHTQTSSCNSGVGGAAVDPNFRIYNIARLQNGQEYAWRDSENAIIQNNACAWQLGLQNPEIEVSVPTNQGAANMVMDWVKVRPFTLAEPTVKALPLLSDYRYSRGVSVTGGSTAVAGSTVTPVASYGSDYVLELHLTGAQAAAVYNNTVYNAINLHNGIPFADVAMFWQVSDGTQRQIDIDADMLTHGAWSANNIDLWFKLQAPLGQSPAIDGSYTLAWGNNNPTDMRNLSNIYPLQDDFNTWSSALWGSQPGWASVISSTVSITGYAASGVLRMSSAITFGPGYAATWAAYLPATAPYPSCWAAGAVYSSQVWNDVGLAPPGIFSGWASPGQTFSLSDGCSPYDGVDGSTWRARSTAAPVGNSLSTADSGEHTFTVARNSAGSSYVGIDTGTLTAQPSLGRSMQALGASAGIYSNNNAYPAPVTTVDWVKVRPWMPNGPTAQLSAQLSDYAYRQQITLLGGTTAVGGSTTTFVPNSSGDYVLPLHITGDVSANIMSQATYNGSSATPFADLSLWWTDSSGTPHQIDTDFDMQTYGPWTPNNIALWFKLQAPIGRSPARDTSYTLAWGAPNPAIHRALGAIYPFFEDFLGSAYPYATMFTYSGTGTVSSSMLNLTSPDPSTLGGAIGAIPLPPGDAVSWDASYPTLTGSGYATLGLQVGSDFLTNATSPAQGGAVSVWSLGPQSGYTALGSAPTGPHIFTSALSTGQAFVWTDASSPTPVGGTARAVGSFLSPFLSTLNGSGSSTLSADWVKVRPWILGGPIATAIPIPTYTYPSQQVNGLWQCPSPDRSVTEGVSPPGAYAYGQTVAENNPYDPIHQSPTITLTTGITTTNPCYDPAYQDWSALAPAPPDAPWTSGYPNYNLYAPPNSAANYRPYNGRWMTIYLKVPTNYVSAPSNPNPWFWYLAYHTNNVAPFTDRLTYQMELYSSAVHLEH